MIVRGRLCVLLGVVLVAVDARPGARYNEVEIFTKPTVENVNDKGLVVDLKLSHETPPQPDVVKAVNERYPHAVLFGFNCGGTIISPTWILTAAHCTISMRGRTVLAGTNNTADGSGVYRHVKRLVVHPLFTVGPYWLRAKEFDIKQVGARWDFLLAELEEPLPLDGKLIAAATLADHDLPAGTDVGYGGYGAKHYRGYMRNVMQGRELSLQEEEICQTLEQYNKEDMLCAKGRPPRYDSACKGDSGSGLVDNNGTLVGVTSWLENDAHECRTGALVVFARVASVRDWIRHVTNI